MMFNQKDEEGDTIVMPIFEDDDEKVNEALSTPSERVSNQFNSFKQINNTINIQRLSNQTKNSSFCRATVKRFN